MALGRLMTLASKIDIPDDLKALNPKLNAKIIVVGDAAYEMYPLTEGAVESLSVEVTQVVNDAIKAIGEASKNPGDPSSMKEPVGIFGDVLLKRGIVAKVISLATGIPEDQVRHEMTIPQIVHAGATLWELNFDVSKYPKVTQGKVEGLLGMLGLGGRGTKRFTQEVLELFLDPGIVTLHELRSKILSSATRSLPSEFWSQMSPRALALLPKTFGDDASSDAGSPEPSATPASPATPSAESPAASSREGTIAG